MAAPSAGLDSALDELHATTQVELTATAVLRNALLLERSARVLAEERCAAAEAERFAVHARLADAEAAVDMLAAQVEALLEQVGPRREQEPQRGGRPHHANAQHNEPPSALVTRLRAALAENEALLAQTRG